MPKRGQDPELDEWLHREANTLVPEIVQKLRDAANATIEKRNIRCPGCNHWVPYEIMDVKSAIQAAEFLMQYTRGRPAQQKQPAVKPKTAGRRLDELSDAELQALAEGADDGETDSGEAEEASG